MKKGIIVLENNLSEFSGNSLIELLDIEVNWEEIEY